ncbi:MAG TPA: SMI1/KNR4 family protein [Hymenobacter sp.]|uniref:SMI1/KNR4 family protein n=1 Tax=Hymenobacter sp. TaxID=1898978 RepID=UPI002EDA9B63
MAPNPFIGTEQPATLADIQAIESAYGFTLPADYKAHVLRHNGGWPTRTVFVQQMQDGRQVERNISSFDAVKHGETTLESSIRSLRSEFHDDLVPFANEGGGDVFVLSIGPEDYGSVHYIAHEFYVPPFSDDDYDDETDTVNPLAPRQYGEGVHFLAPSFTAFLDGLVEGTSYDEDDE